MTAAFSDIVLVLFGIVSVISFVTSLMHAS